MIWLYGGAIDWEKWLCPGEAPSPVPPHLSLEDEPFRLDIQGLETGKLKPNPDSAAAGGQRETLTTGSISPLETVAPSPLTRITKTGTPLIGFSL